MAKIVLTERSDIGTVFEWKGNFKERIVAIENDFTWCHHQKMWYTTMVGKVLGLLDYATDEVKEFIEVLQKSKKLSASSKSDIVIPVPSGCQYYPYQKAGIHYASLRRNTLIADEPGLGKTIQAIGFANLSKAHNILVICPASMKLTWKRELEKWYLGEKNIELAKGRHFSLHEECNIHIINYDILQYVIRKPRFKKFLERGYDLGIFDELHYCKNRTAKRTKAVFGGLGVPSLISICKHNLGLTGTPILNRPVEIFPIVKGLCPDAISNMDYWKFAKRYCGLYLTDWGWDATGATNMEELQEKLRAHVMVRRLKKDVLKDLPKKRYQIIDLETDSKTEGLIKLEKNLDVKQILGGSVDFDNLGELATISKEMGLAKVKACAAHIKDVLESVDKLVIFAHHKAVVSELEEELSKYGVVTLTGSTKTDDRQRAVDTFQSCENTRVFIGNIKAAGIGITLTAASNVIFVESSWVPGEIAQASDRVHRIGQKNAVLVQFLVVRGSIDSMMLNSALTKMGVIDKVVNIEGE